MLPKSLRLRKSGRQMRTLPQSPTPCFRISADSSAVARWLIDPHEVGFQRCKVMKRGLRECPVNDFASDDWGRKGDAADAAFFVDSTFARRTDFPNFSDCSKSMT